MKKSLLSLLTLSALSMQADTEPNYSQIKAQEEETKTLVETIYKHPKARKVGDRMPQPKGEIIAHDFRYDFRRTGEIEKIRLISGYSIDRDEDETIEYEFISRKCDFHKKLKTIAVRDVPNEVLYRDSDGDGYIDFIEEGIHSIEDVWSNIPKCGQEKIRA